MSILLCFFLTFKCELIMVGGSLWLFICCNIMRYNIYAQSCNIYAQSCNIYAQSYNIYAQSCNIYAQTYNIYAQSYNIFLVL